MSFPRYPKYKPSGVEWLGDMPVIFSTNGASCDSPRQRPGNRPKHLHFAPSGLRILWLFGPRVAPWAIAFGPLGAFIRHLKQEAQS